MPWRGAVRMHVNRICIGSEDRDPVPRASTHSLTPLILDPRPPLSLSLPLSLNLSLSLIR
jgi:hypothetical protein